MPIYKEENKYKIGSGKAMYKTRKDAERAYVAYLAKEHDEHKRSSKK